MGIIRLLLALAVVLGHVGGLFGYEMTGGRVAVESFFMLSGFYMALILDEKYVAANSSFRLFITNRFLRIYPTYWLVCLLTVAYSLICWKIFGAPVRLTAFHEYGGRMGTGVWSLLSVSNTVIFGQDIAMFFGLDASSGRLFFTPDFTLHHPQLHEFLLVPQAWSLSLELMFYLLAPLLLRRKSVVLVIIILLGLFLRLVLIRKGWSNDPWNYRLFPAELVFFLAGALAFRMYHYWRGKDIPQKLPVFAAGLIIALIVSYSYLPGDELRNWTFYLLLFTALPFIFIFSRKRRADRWVGELSYPVYIVHILVFTVCSSRFISSRIDLSLATLIGSLLLSVLILRWFIQPIERFRQARLIPGRLP